MMVFFFKFSSQVNFALRPTAIPDSSGNASERQIDASLTIFMHSGQNGGRVANHSTSMKTDDTRGTSKNGCWTVKPAEILASKGRFSSVNGIWNSFVETLLFMPNSSSTSETLRESARTNSISGVA